MAGRAKENLSRGSLKYLFVYLKVRICKCGYRIRMYAYNYIYIYTLHVSGSLWRSVYEYALARFKLWFYICFGIATFARPGNHKYYAAIVTNTGSQLGRMPLVLASLSQFAGDWGSRISTRWLWRCIWASSGHPLQEVTILKNINSAWKKSVEIRYQLTGGLQDQLILLHLLHPIF